ncbi:MAG: co-chaperone GroES, partial [Clostridia bacterium]|nr:co-chaperone GroES [Clostridia bacterium]
SEKGERLPLEVKVGDRVIYSKFAGDEIKFKGEKYLILSEREILAVEE